MTTHDEAPMPGAAIQAITFKVGTCTFGLILAATTSRGVCAILLGSDEKALTGQLRSAFPKATLQSGGREIERVLSDVVHFVETPTGVLRLPLDVHGTEFQKRVWNALRTIPAGQTASYMDIALKLGATAQEIGQACAANTLAVVIPCHRVVRSDGALAGYRWGTNRKRMLLAREQELSPDPESLFSIPGFRSGAVSI